MRSSLLPQKGMWPSQKMTLYQDGTIHIGMAGNGVSGSPQWKGLEIQDIQKMREKGNNYRIGVFRGAVSFFLHEISLCTNLWVSNGGCSHSIRLTCHQQSWKQQALDTRFVLVCTHTKVRDEGGIMGRADQRLAPHLWLTLFCNIRELLSHFLTAKCGYYETFCSL